MRHIRPNLWPEFSKIPHKFYVPTIILASFRPERHESQKRRPLAFRDDIIRVLSFCLGDVNAFASLSRDRGAHNHAPPKIRIGQEFWNVESAEFFHAWSPS
ncbi:MAG: hypothetical protein NTW21_25365 [Verrucomicrobia bacterium]|nr:hypothetical protein [Verrucomicrobiota bacterium]